MNKFTPFSKKIYIGLFVFIVLSVVISSLFFMTKRDSSGFSFVAQQPDNVETLPATEDDFFALEDDVLIKSREFNLDLHKNKIISMDNSVQLSEFSRFYNYYIPSGINYIVAAYHYENLVSDEHLNFANWSSEDYENLFMKRNGASLYSLFLIKSVGKTLDYGFIPLNNNVFNSIEYNSFLNQYLN